MAKGSEFERSICKLFSLWWTDQQDDSVFWRTSQSGGRATVRRRKGKGTRGHVGDVTATDPDGVPFTNLITLELKKGYSTCSVAQIVDRPQRLKQQGFEAFLEQAMTAADNAGTPYWGLIHRRTGKEIMIYLPNELIEKLGEMGCHLGRYGFIVIAPVRLKDGRWAKVEFTGTRLSAFFAGVDPQDIRTLSRQFAKASRREKG